MRALQRIELEGEYDLSRKGEAAASFGSLTADEPAIVDMSRVTYIDSTFLQELATLHLRLKEHGATLVGVSQPVLRILRLARFEQLFRIVES